MRRRAPVVQAGRVTARHIVRGLSTDPGTVQVLDTWFVPARSLQGGRDGLSGRAGFASGTFEPRLGEEGLGTLRLPNTVGRDGVGHLERFDITRPGYDSYRPGDEWIEIYHEGTTAGKPRFVGTPIGARVSRGELELRLADAWWLLKKTRETAAGYWAHAPRDAFEHYTGVWAEVVADDFADTIFSYSTSDQTTGDGGWTYRRAENAPGDTAARLRVAGAGQYAEVMATEFTDLAGETAWRFEAELDRSAFAGDTLNVGLADNAGDFPFFLSITGGITNFQAPGPDVDLQLDTESGLIQVAIERRDRWVYVYIDTNLKLVYPYGTDPPDPVAPWVRLNTGGAPERTVNVRNLRFRTRRPFLLRGPAKGDYHLPGAPTPGGLIGTYFNDTDLEARYNTNWPDFAANPTREPYARRLDPQINFPTANPPAWQPAGPSNYFSVRWTGAIYLDLAAQDRRVRLQVDDAATVWIGKTRLGEHVATGSVGTFTSAQLRTVLGEVDGWYPIVIEYLQDTASGGVSLEWETSPGVWAAVPADKLSPLGCYETQVRHESHYEQLRALVDQFGLQVTCEPRQLESGEFPGQLIPKVRQGRDTEKVLDSIEGTDIQTEISAEDVADVLVADAAGIAEDGAQLTLEHLNFDQATAHLFLQQEAESLSDITIESNLKQRLNTLLALRSSPWEEVGVRPGSRRELLDSLPLTGALAEFKWDPGDGIRLDLPELGVKDTSPRQIMGVSWPFVPAGLQLPSAAFRQRPRNFKETLRRFLRVALAPQRTYQGQLATTTGTLGRNPTSADLPSQTSYVPLPQDLAAVVSAELVVSAKGDGSSMQIEVNGTNRLAITGPGHYDVTAWVARGASGDRMNARLTGGTSFADYFLELKVRI